MSDSIENATAIAALQQQVQHITAMIDEIKIEASARSKKQSDDHRALMEKLEAMNQVMAKQQGFLNGAAFTVKIFWVAVGVFGAAILNFLQTGQLPPIK